MKLIKNSKLKAQTNKGYTLIELVIVIAVLLVFGGIVVGILYSTIRGTTKAKINNSISQNGNYAITAISNFLANAKFLKSVITSENNEVNSCIGGVKAKSVSIIGFDDQKTTFSCEINAQSLQETISSNSASLIDLSQVEIVAETCSFTCFQKSVFSPPRIDVAFELQNVGQSIEATVPFRTSVSLRNSGL